jgi:hypothetical protein
MVILVGLVAAACGSSSSTETGASSTTMPKPNRFEVRPVVTASKSPCGAGQVSFSQPRATVQCLTLGPTALDGSDVASVSVSSSPSDGPGIDVRLTAAGLARFNTLARQLFGGPSPRDEVALLVDGRVFSNPRLNTDHFDSNGIRIGGSFTSEAEAGRVARAIGRVTPPTG